MFNKRKKDLLDPMRINNYNKFLTTLDNNNINNRKNSKFDEIKRTLRDEISIKKEIDNIIDKINTNFNMNELSSSNFTGQTPNDISLSFIQNNDPNKYIDYLNKNLNMKFYKNFNYCVPPPYNQKDFKKEEIQVPIRETIHIEVEINNISDILKLIDTYKYDPAIKYNIDIKSLHNIKEHLEELNNMIGMNELKNSIVDQILYFIQELHKNNKSGDFLHTVIYGPPGSGKTEIAKIMGKIYSKIGVSQKDLLKR